MTLASTLTLSDSAIKRRDWQIISLIGTVHASSHFFQLVLPTLYLSLAHEYGYDFAQLGLLASVFFWCPAWGKRHQGLWWIASVRRPCCVLAYLVLWCRVY